MTGEARMTELDLAGDQFLDPATKCALSSPPATPPVCCMYVSRCLVFVHTEGIDDCTTHQYIHIEAFHFS